MNETSLEQAREAASNRDWDQAYRLLREADGVQALELEDLALLGTVAYAAGHLDQTIEAWERAHAGGVCTGDRLSAAGAATRVALHLLFDTALLAPVRGWIKRAELLLDGFSPTPVHAWLAVVRNYERMFSGDFAQARHWARQAIEIGTRCDSGAAAIGRIAEARALVLEGEVSRGLELLDDAAMAASSGELDPLSSGIVYCEVVCALQGLAQYDRAEEWTIAMERWRKGKPVGSLHGRCRVHRAEIFRLRGSLDEAEQEALRACEELRPYLRREFGWPLTELGRIRLRKGDLAGAEEAFLAAQQTGWDPQPGAALVYLARGDVVLAAASIRNALDHPSTIPSKELPPNTGLRRAPLLEAQVEIAIEAGDLDRARWAADELARIAIVFGSSALAAGGAMSAGRVHLAERDAERSLREFERALHLWSDIGAPYETALARMGIAQAHRAAGNLECAGIELRAARAGFEQVGALRQAEQAARLLADMAPGAAAGAAPRSPPIATAGRDPSHELPGPRASAFRREGEYWSLTFDGQTTRLRDTKGMRYLARLLAEPRRDFHVLDLVAAERGWMLDVDGGNGSGSMLASSWGTGAILDAPAKNAYRRRLAEIEEDIEAARATADVGREERADAERDFLLRELSRAVGLGGRDRRPDSASERARASVTRALRFALARIRAHSPHLGVHLDHSVRTGTYCAYRPDPEVPANWDLRT